MLQTEVVNAVGDHIDIEDPAFMKYPITTLHSLSWIIISVIVTIHQTVPIQRYQSSHCITTAKLGSSI
jgi:hypothetical protein